MLLSSRLTAPIAALAVAASLVGACDSGQPALVFSPNNLPDGHPNQPYAQTITIAENRTPLGGISILDGSLPAGLTIEKIPGSNNAGRIVGTPVTTGTADFTVSVYCLGTNVSGQTGTKRYTLSVR